MNYLIKLFFIFIIFYLNTSIANDNSIIFEINNKIYSSLDLNYRIDYLEEINGIKYSASSEKEFKDDFFRSVIFFEYVKNNNRLKKILSKESDKILTKIKKDFNLSNDLKDEIILKNVNYDYSKKLVLEDLLNNYREYIFSQPKNINVIYNFKIKYITIPIDNLINKDILTEINNLKKPEQLINLFQEKNIEYFIADKNIKDLNKISNKLKKLINSNVKIKIEKNSRFYQIITIEKKLEFNQGIFYNLINFETENQLSNDKENCNYIKSLNNIKSSKEYELNKLNENIKKNLKDINDFLIFQNNNKLNYIFLCQIRVNEDFLKEVNIKKKIDFIVKNIELDFINNYSKQYNAKKFYE